MSYRVLVTAAGGVLAPVNIQLLRGSRRHQVWVAAVDSNPDAVGRHFADAFAAVPGGEAPGYVDAMVDLVVRYGVDLVIPWSDEEALALAQGRERIQAAGATLACAPFETLSVMADKAKTYRLLQTSGIGAPDWTAAVTLEELEEAIDTYVARDGEFAVKPLVARGNRNVYVVRRDVSGVEDYLGSREVHCDLETFRRDFIGDVAALLPVIVMERLVPPAFDIDVLARDGRLLRAAPRQRLNPAGVPFWGGILVARDDLMEIAEQVTEAVKLSWLYDYDVMTTRDGRPVVIELNPRPSGSIAAAIIAGVPFYDDLISLAKGEELPQVDMPTGQTVVPYTALKIVAGMASGGGQA